VDVLVDREGARLRIVTGQRGTAIARDRRYKIWASCRPRGKPRTYARRWLNQGPQQRHNDQPSTHHRSAPAVRPSFGRRRIPNIDASHPGAFPGFRSSSPVHKRHSPSLPCDARTRRDDQLSVTHRRGWIRCRCWGQLPSISHAGRRRRPRDGTPDTRVAWCRLPTVCTGGHVGHRRTLGLGCRVGVHAATGWGDAEPRPTVGHS